MEDLKIRIAATTDVGLIRTNNEDNFTVCPDLSAPDWANPQNDEAIDLGGYGALLVVADGMGGANAGEVASAIAIETVKQQFSNAKLVDIVEAEESILKFITSTIKKADLNIVEAAKDNAERAGMGTTIVMAWIIGTKAYIGWCGDSRCYVLNPKYGFTRLSKDHSYVQELVDAGQLTEDQAFDHPMSNVITRCLGDAEHRAKPDTHVYDMRKGDIIMLCSDGLCGLCRDNEIMEVVTEQADNSLPVMRDALIAAALRAGGHDNVTVALGTLDGMKELEATPTNELAGTVPVKTSNHKWMWILCCLLIIGALAYFCYTLDSSKPMKPAQELMANADPIAPVDSIETDSVLTKEATERNDSTAASDTIVAEQQSVEEPSAEGETANSKPQ